MSLKHRSPDEFLADVARRDPHQPEFLQAVKEVVHSLWPFLQDNPRYLQQGLLERLVEPERLIQFRVAWSDDAGQAHVNRAWRVQHSSAIGPFKGGMRFHPSVNLSILKFLAFEQTFKNALTTLPMGGGKGGSDFDPKGRSDAEVMRFCQALMLELHRHLGPDTDVPAGDIGVGAREVGYMAGMMKKLSNDAACVFTGKGLSYGGSLMRPEATGYGTVYFVEQMLHHARRETHGARVLVSGSGNVAQYAALKATELGAKVLTFSDSGGTLYARDGFDEQALQELMALKNARRGRLQELAADTRFEFLAGKRPWHVPADIALPCATQNELDEDDARTLVHNGVQCVAEGANMPSTLEAVDVFLQAGTLYAPGKASNAGGVATSGLEMSQNAQRLSWHHADVDERLHAIMKDIHASCVRHGKRADGSVNYVDGANIAGFVKVADAMLAQGLY
ncbi:NADP-specific glutamate dehydrogenase [Stenotrophomonas sp. ZAC14D1_NAIMI4_6]|uniref:NADP-specific glutamate dehydrogenase n=1 Tax=unclassified Stenotrophomonas maltophilia group TaxID=2961925 RepID=UPI000D542C89|nr:MULTISPECIES: NADP-specific glutamate dehydrogenase [unclassified Stenotrophomonas maltophilia group]AWH38409.1 NADP-specific glutamate dehydrogenase [Stenotrophomonas sp. ZAC14D1_NAIMI4_6]AWH42540.1 NADP-specific glutamate dehydrogenase [Stenotrophomonas sp. ZAC14D1_NAIMI4_1]